MDIRKAAVELFGKGYSNEAYIRALANTLKMSQSGVRKIWFRQRKLSATAEELIKTKIEMLENLTPDDLTGPLTDATGRVIPAEHFENDLPICEACKAAGKVCDHTHD